LLQFKVNYMANEMTAAQAAANATGSKPSEPILAGFVPQQQKPNQASVAAVDDMDRLAMQAEHELVSAQEVTEETTVGSKRKLTV
jgi:hypothetical protein